MKHEILTDPADLQPGDICVFLYVSKAGTTKWKAGKFHCWTRPESETEAPVIVLADGRIPEFDGYELVVSVRPVPDFEEVGLFDGEEVG